MTLNTILKTPVENEITESSGEWFAGNDLAELSDEELDILDAMLALFLGYSKDCWNDQLGERGSELFFLWGTPSQLMTEEEESKLQPQADADL